MIGKQPLKLKSAKIYLRYQDKCKTRPARPGPALSCIYLGYLGYIFADFNLSGGCFPMCLNISYQMYVHLHIFK